MQSNPEQVKIATHLRSFWDRMVAEAEQYNYCQASCFVADYFAAEGFLHDYGDGVYHPAEKGKIWATKPFYRVVNGEGGDIFENWLDLAAEVMHSHPQVEAECLKHADVERNPAGS